MVKSYRPGGVGMLPAAPGTYLVHAYFDDNQIELIKANIIGWQIGAERGLTPLVVDPRAAEDDSWNIIHPDGRVEAVDGHVWESVDLWVDELRRMRRAVA